MLALKNRCPSRPSFRPTLELLETRNLLAGSQTYVAHLYQDLLHRSADPRGLASWSAQLDAGMSRTEVVRRITAGDEYRSALIDHWFRTCMGRPANANDVAALKGLPTSRQILTAILTSEEYYADRSGGTS